MAQFIFIVIISLGLYGLSNSQIAQSVALGGLVAFLPMCVFAKKLFAYHGAQAAKKIVHGFYSGEALKLMLSIVLFILVFLFFKIEPLSFFLMYIAVVMSHWLAPVVINK